MSRNPRRSTSSDNVSNPLEAKSFPERLLSARTARGWSQSDLAREIWGSTIDTRGYPVANHRDRISAWEGGRSIPDPHNLQKLCDVMGMTQEELAPELVAKSMARTTKPEIQITMGQNGDPNLVHLTINTFTSLVTAMQIGTLLAQDKATIAIAAGERLL